MYVYGPTTAESLAILGLFPQIIYILLQATLNCLSYLYYIRIGIASTKSSAVRRVLILSFTVLSTIYIDKGFSLGRHKLDMIDLASFKLEMNSRGIFSHVYSMPNYLSFDSQILGTFYNKIYRRRFSSIKSSSASTIFNRAKTNTLALGINQ